ncbi:DUF998 domain-containing protein [Gordonia sp. 852002-10350_SCH5691597]|uniref:DUF998 domain-containing protein n=1 Tax=Gordonia sp. 852002-10350_SCH5691597 TaxID=1834085 RepID=UPI0007EA151A|nr:DUF998 domain-containing protein [Gordonia sp. 852002-10350_SCH5691597]OBA69791.1 hypothetical protein A5777_13630 [Gordonia sp. 852002-10350_SCH5691597]
MSQFLDPRRDPTSAQADGQRERPKLPDSVAIACELWIVVVIARIVTAVAQYPTLRDMMNQRVSDLPADTPRAEVDLMTSSGFLIAITVITAVVLSAISLTFVWFVRKGYNWARVLLGAMGVFVLIDMAFSLIAGVDPWWIGIPLIIGGIAALGATILLLRRESDAYCRAMAAYRKPQPTPPGYPAPPGHPPQYPQTPPYPPYPQSPPPYTPYPQSYGQAPDQQPPAGGQYPDNAPYAQGSPTSWEDEARRRGWQPPTTGESASPQKATSQTGSLQKDPNTVGTPSGTVRGDYSSGEGDRPDEARLHSHENESTPRSEPSTDRKQSSDPS